MPYASNQVPSENSDTKPELTNESPPKKLQGILGRLQDVRPSGNGWEALCPAHPDKNPSLSISRKGGRILLHCFAGCPNRAILAALGMKARDLFLDVATSPRIVATYQYQDEAGKLLYEVVRYDPKYFRQRRPDTDGNWIWNLQGVRRVPYQLPEVLKADAVLVLEGEKDCDNAKSLGLTATCNSEGAGKWRVGYSEYLRGKDVTIIADADEPGRNHARGVATSLFGKVKSLKLLELPGAKDLSEWRELGGTRELLTELLHKTPEWKPEGANTPPSAEKITFVTAKEFLGRTSRDERPYLVDNLLPACSQTIWQGRPKVGKSHSLLQFAFDGASGLPIFGHFQISRPFRTAYVELEEPEAQTKERYTAMLRAHRGLGPDRDYLHFFTREDLHRLRILPRELLGNRLRDFASALHDTGAELVILIAVRRFIPPGQSLKDPEVAERINDALDEILAETGAAIALANHDRKGEASTLEAQGFGSTFLSARADGIFDLRRQEGNLRCVGIEARFQAPERFFLRREVVEDGELIRWCEGPLEKTGDQRLSLATRVDQGESMRGTAKSLGIPYSTASRWERERKSNSS